MSESDTKKAVYGILEFLHEEYNKSSTSVDSKESIEVAMQCLETAFGVNLKDTQFKPKVSLRNAVNNAGPTSTSAGAPSQSQPSAPEPNISLGEPYNVPPPANAADQKTADDYKNTGNEKMKEGLFQEAKQAYDKAIELDGRNAVYFCNRAAAFLKLDDSEKALRDCQIAVQLQPNYARAYGRMGVVYSTVSQHSEAIKCYQKAYSLEPENESYQNNLKHTEELVRNAAPRPGPGIPGMGAFGGTGDGGMPNLQSLFADPNLINMASQMLQNPMMLNMMRDFVSGYRTQGGNEGPAGAAAPPPGAPPAPGLGGNNMEGFMQIGQQIAQQIRNANPNLAEQLGNLANPQQPRSSPQGDSYDL